MSDLFRLKLVSKRQVTIPQRVMDLLGLRLGDEIHLKIANGKIIQAYPVKLGPDEEMSEDAKRRFEEIEKETKRSGLPDTDITSLMDDYAGGPQFEQRGAEPIFNMKDYVSVLNYGFPGLPSLFANACRVAPRNFQRTDERIAELVAESLASARINVSGVEIGVEKGIVTLLGRMSDKSSRLIVELAARSVLGVKEVNNNIEVDIPLELDVPFSLPRIPDLKVK